MAKHVSIKDIARLANVSHSTVSRAMRNSPLVNPETTKMIRELASEHGYRPSWIGRSLVMRETKTIGCAVTSIADPFFGPVVRGIEDVANEQGYSVFLANSTADPAREVQVVRSFQERRVDGILVTASRVGSEYVSQLAELDVPLVLINNQHSGSYVHSVSIANTPAVRGLVRHLVSLGHKRIAYIGDRYGFQSDNERLTGYREGLAEAGIPIDERLVVQGDSQPESGRLAARELLTLDSRPTAIVSYNDLTALGVYAELRDSGLDVPKDVSVTGFDDLFFASYLKPALTTVRQPMGEMGRRAAEILLTLLAGRESDRNISVDGELMIRASTAPVRP